MAKFVGAEPIFNGSTEVEIVAAPGSGKTRELLSVFVNNLDTVAHTFSLRKKKTAGSVTRNYPTLTLDATGTQAAKGYLFVGSIVLDDTDENVVVFMEGAHTTTAPVADVAAFED